VRLGQWVFALSATAFVVGAAVTTILAPLGRIEKQLAQVAPWVVCGVAITETAWVVGAVLMASGAGQRIGNPFRLRPTSRGVTQGMLQSRAFRAGLHINTAGALGTAVVVVVGAVVALPRETWPGVFGLAAADVVGTAAARSGIYLSIMGSRSHLTRRGRRTEVSVRKARLEDIGRLADIDLQLFAKAYGATKPSKDGVASMLRKRLRNAPDDMFVAEIDGVVEGFVSGFRTNTPIEAFVSWEHSTADGTLEGKVDRHGKYAYVTNLTLRHSAVTLGAEDMLLAHLFANGVEYGVEYAYFVSRMPLFKHWLDKQVDLVTSNRQQFAEQYYELRRPDGGRYDPQLRMYEKFGLRPKRLVADAFSDAASLDYGVVFQADMPVPSILRKIPPARQLVAFALRKLARHPKMLRRVLNGV
jgi:hypothetical protein